MTGSLVARKRNIQCKTKVKTGCGTCRKRKIKCDENKPVCQKCLQTGRSCDGYESPFRHFTSHQPISSYDNNNNNNNNNAQARGGTIRPPPVATTLLPEIITPQDIDLLNRYFSTKTLFDVNLGCDEEARQVLQASLTDPTIRHAVSSLRALREDLETMTTMTTMTTTTTGAGTGTVPEASVVAQQQQQQQQQTTTPSYGYDYGVQQYCMALSGLASNLSSSSSPSSPGSSTNTFQLKSALLCCQIFISIEQVRGNYAAMAQHIIQGLRIMREYRARPNFVVSAENRLLVSPAGPAANHGNQHQLPLLDVFVIKLFAAPCKFADPARPRPPAATGTAESISGTTTVSSVCLHQDQHHQDQQPAVESRDDLRAIAPDMRTELTRIAASTLEFLGKVSHVDESAGNALQLPLLLSEKASLLNSLESWLVDLELLQTEINPGPGPELLSVSFKRLFHQILKIILLGTLEDYSSSPDLYAKLQTENDRLQAVANIVGERVEAYYRTSSETRSGRGERYKIPWYL